MRFKEYTWDKQFDIKGYFYEKPDSIFSEKNLSGILHYTPGEIVLELFGAFKEEANQLFDFGKYLEKIYGLSSDGRILILNTYGDASTITTYPGFPLTKYRVKSFKIFDVNYNGFDNLVDDSESLKNLIKKLESSELKKYKFSFEHIEEWIGKPLVSARISENQTIFESKVNDYNPTTVFIKSLGMNFKDTAILNSSFTNMSFTSDYFIEITLADSSTRSFSEFYQASIKYKEFIEVLSNQPLFFNDIEFLVDYRMVGDKYLPLIKGKFFVHHDRKTNKWDKNLQNEFSLKALEGKIEDILNNWFDKSDRHEFIVRQFSKNLHGDLYLEDQFIDSIKNLEVYSRNFRDFEIKNELSNLEEQERQSLINYINTYILEEFRSKFRNRFRCKKREPALSERLKDLFDSIDENNQTKILANQDIGLLITKLTQTRNYYTHGDSKEKYPQMITEVSEMYATMLLLQEVLRYYIYQELDMEYR